MQQPYQKPENALKRAEEYIAIGQSETALSVLHAAISHRKFKSGGWDSVQEQALLRHGQLCVDLQRLKYAREGLHQYRSVSQTASVQSLGLVVTEFRERVEKRMKSVQALIQTDEEAKKRVRDELDLEALETPENIMVSTLQIEVCDAASEKIHAALRFTWESYKMILDVIRIVPKLERVYHDTAQKAFQFCNEHDRYTEFKRLCDLLRSHYLVFQRLRHKPDYEALLRPEIHLETRMVQLGVACDLGLWREACNTAEDIHSLGLHELFNKTLRSSTEAFPKAKEYFLKWLAAYFEKMAEILWVSDNLSFHALAFVKYLLHIRKFRRNIERAEIEDLCSIAVLATLSVATSDERERKSDSSGSEAGRLTLENQRKLAAMLGHPTIPNREFLTSAICSKDILEHAKPCCQKLYACLERKCTPLKLCIETLPLLKELESMEGRLARYVQPLKRVIFRKLLLQLFTVYKTLCVDYFVTKICPTEFYPWNVAEKKLVQYIHNTTIDLRLDYSNKVLYFGSKSLDPAIDLKDGLTNIANQLALVSAKIDSTTSQINKQAKEKFLANFATRVDAEHKAIKKRNVENELRRQEKQAEQLRAIEHRRKFLEQQRAHEERAELRRREEALRRREEKRMKEEKYRAKSVSAQQMLEEIKKMSGNRVVIKGKQLDEIDIADVLDGNVVYEDIERAQEEERNRQRLEKVKLRRQDAKRLDHFLRACREEEKTLLAQWRDETLQRDNELILRLQEQHEEEQKAEHERLMKEKALFVSYAGYKKDFLNKTITMLKERATAESAMSADDLRQLKQDKIQRARKRAKAQGIKTAS